MRWQGWVDTETDEVGFLQHLRLDAPNALDALVAATCLGEGEDYVASRSDDLPSLPN